ncbi:T9SS type A sorting domain-containing protein [bacterium]|nr:T9SS type A sorting domain-containing protein [bacterium]
MKNTFIFAALFFVASASAVTLVQRSTGLSSIDWEEGHTELELGDVNADGHLDLLSVGDHGNPNVNSTEHGVICYLGDGLGNWTAQQFGNFGYGGLGLGDLNLDGHMDLAFGIHHDWASTGLGSKLMGVGLGNGSGAMWTPWDTGMPSAGEEWGMFATDLADFNGDGLLDVVSQSFGGSNGIQIYRNLGDGNWEHAGSFAGGSVNYTLETGDFNADGYLDFVGTRSTGSVYLGDGNFGFSLNQTGITSGIYSVDVGDFDHDGRDDLLIDHGGAGVKAWRLSQTTETWEEFSTGLPSYNAEQVQFGDLNGDGYLDVVAYAEPTGSCYINNGASAWNLDASWTMPSPGDGNALRVDGDVDHDGREDIAVLASMSGFPFYRNQLRVYSPWEEPIALSTQVLKPNGGESFKQGSIRELRWATAMPSGQGQASVDIYLSTTGSVGPYLPIATALADNGRYDWLVLAEVSEDCFLEIRSTGGGDTSIDRSDAAFSILDGGATSLPDGIAKASFLNVYPNPLGRSTRFTWNAGASNSTVLSIFELSGRLVEKIRLSPGVNHLQWATSRNLSSGIYMAELRSGSMRVTRKLLILDPR